MYSINCELSLNYTNIFMNTGSKTYRLTSEWKQIHSKSYIDSWKWLEDAPFPEVEVMCHASGESVQKHSKIITPVLVL